MIVVDEYLALLRLAGQAPEQVRSEMLALTYGRAYRLTRALLDPGPGRLAVRGRFSRLVEASRPQISSCCTTGSRMRIRASS